MILALQTTAFSARGGIQTYNRMVCRALNELDDLAAEDRRILIAMDRQADLVVEARDFPNLTLESFAGNRISFVRRVLATALREPISLALIGHVNYAQLGWLLKKLRPQMKYGVVLYGIEAWQRLPYLKMQKVNSYANYRTPYWRTLASFPYLKDFFGNGTAASYKGYVPTFDGDLIDYNATFGLRSRKNGWNFDVSLTIGFNSQDYTVFNSHNRSSDTASNGAHIYQENSPISFKPGGSGLSKIQPLLPLNHLIESRNDIKNPVEYIYEPGFEEVFFALLQRYLEGKLYLSVLESLTSEYSARMMAMKQASENGQEVLYDLKLLKNKTRQAVITRELSEIVSGASVLV